MSTKERIQLVSMPTADDKSLTMNRRDLSAGANSRLDGQDIGEQQAVTLNNVDIGVSGQTKKIPGLTSLEDLNKDACLGLYAFEPDGGTHELRTVVLSGSNTSFLKWSGSSFSAISSSTDIVDSDLPTAVKVFKTGGDGHVMLTGSKTTNWHEIDQAGSVTDLTDDSDDPPQSNVGTFYNGRFWVLVGNQLYFSDAFPSDYAGAFNRATDIFNMPVGTARFLIGIRGKGLICGGKDNISYIIPSNTPAATDETGILVKDGCVANRSAMIVGDDILYMARDGVRGVFKTQYDTLQYKTSLPLSYPLKDEFETINWAYIHLAAAIYFDNKYFLALPISSSTTNNSVWVYYPATNGWMVIDGWNVADWDVLTYNGEERLYAVNPTDGNVYRAWFGSDNDGADINYSEVGRKDDVLKPFTEKRGGEVIVRAKASGEYHIKVYGSFDESDFTQLGEVYTADRETNFASWTFPMIFQDAGIYTKKFHLDRYGPWYQMQIKIGHDGTGGGDITILQRSIITHEDKYYNEED